MVFEGKWIQASTSTGDVCPVFRKDWFATDSVRKAELIITALGVYEAVLNGSRVSEDVLMPGWTVYEKRLQYQTYDITELLETENSLTVTVGKGWFSSPMPGWLESEDKERRKNRPRGFSQKSIFIWKMAVKKSFQRILHGSGEKAVSGSVKSMTANIVTAVL